MMADVYAQEQERLARERKQAFRDRIQTNPFLCALWRFVWHKRVDDFAEYARVVRVTGWRQAVIDSTGGRFYVRWYPKWWFGYNDL